MLKILLVLLPLAASAACSRRDVSTCTKCGVGAIGMQFDGSTPCNCNDNAGMSGKMCPKTGAPTYPTCCSVDGKAATVQNCKCGTISCQADQKCTAATNKCEYPVCAKTDGSAASTSEKQCQCGTNSCSKGQKCTASSSTCALPVCSSTDGKAAITNPGCKCGTNTCYSTSQTCTASTNECKSPATPTPKVLPRCKVDVVTTVKCSCQKGDSASSANDASIGQICPKDSKTPVWPACKGSDVFKTMNQNCKCADKDDCSYGQKCTQTGDFKGFCECVPSADVICSQKVPASEKCPKTCDGHTTMGATPIVVNKCVNYYGSIWVKRTAANDKYTAVYYSDECKTKITLKNPMMPTEGSGGCQPGAETFVNIPASAAGSTALQVVAMPVALVAGLLGFILL